MSRPKPCPQRPPRPRNARRPSPEPRCTSERSRSWRPASCTSSSTTARATQPFRRSARCSSSISCRAVVVAVGLVAPLGRVAGRYAEAVRAGFAVSGIGIAVGSLVGLFVSESSGLFGFVEHGYRTAIVLAIVAEVAAVVFLAVYLAANGAGIDKLRSRSG